MGWIRVSTREKFGSAIPGVGGSEEVWFRSGKAEGSLARDTQAAGVLIWTQLCSP